MKNFLINYYALIIVILFVIYNFILDELIIMGLLYKIIMLLFIVINIIILIIFRKKIKYKNMLIIYCLTSLFTKNIMQYLFALSNIIILCIIGFKENKFIKIFSIFFGIFIAFCWLPLLFVLFIFFGINLDEEKYMNDIYEYSHYYCDNNYETYTYSAGATDKFHYSIGKYYDILNYNDIINIIYRERNETTFKEYTNFINDNNCKLVGGIDEYK